MRLVLAGVLILASGPLLAAEDQTINATVHSGVDGDIPVKFSRATRLPLPATDGKVEVIGAAINFEPRPKESTKIWWRWSFVLKSIGTGDVSSIKVEDIREAPGYIECEVQSPEKRDGTWSCIAPAQPLDQDFLAFLDSGKPMFFFHRLSVAYTDKSTSRLYQPSLHDSQTLISGLKTTAALMGLPLGQ